MRKSQSHCQQSYCVKCFFAPLPQLDPGWFARYHVDSCWWSAPKHLRNHEKYGFRLHQITPINHPLCDSCQSGFIHERGPQNHAGNRPLRRKVYRLPNQNRYHEQRRWCKKRIEKLRNSSAIWLCRYQESMPIRRYQQRSGLRISQIRNEILHYKPHLFHSPSRNFWNWGLDP